MGTLGTGKNVAWIYMKGGKIPVAPIETPKSLEWSRVLNDVSDATVEVTTGQHGDCCSIYGKLGTWGHEIVVFRDGVRTWEGPITNIKWRRGGVSLYAQDPLAWTKKRATSAKGVLVPDYVEKQGWEMVGESMGASLPDHDPNVVPYAQRLAANTGPVVTRDVKLAGGMYYDQWLELAKSGLMFTFVGRRLLVWHSAHVMGRTANLLPDHLSGEIEVEEDGMQVGVRVLYANDDEVVGSAGPPDSADPFYGLNDLLVSSDAPDAPTLSAMAETHREAHYPAPLAVNVPQGSVLSCDTPISMEELVAGTVVPVKVEGGICRPVLATQQLQSVTVTDGPEGEKVAITVTPASGLVLP